MFKKVHNINNPRKLIPAKKSLNGQTAKINTRNAIFFQKEKTAKISTIKVISCNSVSVAALIDIFAFEYVGQHHEVSPDVCFAGAVESFL